MCRYRYVISCAALLFGNLVLPLMAQSAQDPLRLISDDADLIVKIDNPRRLVQAALDFQPLRQLQQFEAVQEIYQSTNLKRFTQLVEYFERELKAPWPELLERLGGEGGALFVSYGSNQPVTVGVLQGRDATLVHKFFKLAVQLLEQELARTESDQKIERTTYRKIEIVGLGPTTYMATTGSAIIFSNNKKALHHCIDKLIPSTKGLATAKEVAEANILLPANPLLWIWMNLEKVHKAPQAKEVFAQPRNDTNLTVLFGGLLDVARRAQFLCVAIYGEASGLRLTVRMPRGREGMDPAMALHIPPSSHQGALPLLEPQGVLYSASYYFDLSQIWQGRAGLFNKQQVQTFEQFDKKAAPFLLGHRPSEILGKLGAHPRLVIVREPRSSVISLKAGNGVGYALALDMRDSSVAKTLEAIIRGAAFLVGTQVQMKLVEEKRGDVKIVGYRIANEKPSSIAANVFGIYPEPCFAVVGNQIVFCSSLKVAHGLINALQKDCLRGVAAKGELASLSCIYSASGAELLRQYQDRLLAQTILSQALAPDKAKEQVERFIKWVGQLGTLRLEGTYKAREFHYEIIYSGNGTVPDRRAAYFSN